MHFSSSLMLVVNYSGQAPHLMASKAPTPVDILIHRDIGRLDQVGPLGGFTFDETRELFGRTPGNLAAGFLTSSPA